MSVAIVLVMTMRAAKSVMYSEADTTGWRQVLPHVYDVPPLVQLTLLQLSFIFMLAKIYLNNPGIIPETVSLLLGLAAQYSLLFCHAPGSCASYGGVVSCRKFSQSITEIGSNSVQSPLLYLVL